jgi:hypothetical protein
MDRQRKGNWTEVLEQRGHAAEGNNQSHREMGARRNAMPSIHVKSENPGRSKPRRDISGYRHVDRACAANLWRFATREVARLQPIKFAASEGYLKVNAELHWRMEAFPMSKHIGFVTRSIDRAEALARAARKSMPGKLGKRVFSMSLFSMMLKQ